nr:hypothetical protein [Candidatus Sigynarchaeota archaeon]
MSSNTQDAFKSRLEALFPGYQQKEHLNDEGLNVYVIHHEHTTETNPCYAYGYQIGEDISHRFNTTLLVLPADNSQSKTPGYVTVHIDGYTTISERYDQHSVSVTCEIENGKPVTIEDHYYYEKYGGQSRDTKNPLDAVLLYFQEHMGYTSLSEKSLVAWFSKMRSHFSY